jgi:Ca2+-binding RTX toxin-like protein
VLQADGSYVEIVPADGVFDLSSYTSLLTSSTAISGTDKLYLTTTSALPAGFAPTMTLETTDAGSTALTILGGSASSSHVGSTGNDYINGGAGDDTITSGAGNDLLVGGTGSDTFVWHLADVGVAGVPAKDTISDFSIASKATGGDAIDLRDLLQGENHTTGTGNLTDFLHFSKSGSDTIIDVKATGASGEVTQQIVLSNVDLTANSSLNDQAIIQDLLTKGKLVTD